jgi:pyruvate dehydrogenase E2 component (dihydrolipoamide acetyltransferase)
MAEKIVMLALSPTMEKGTIVKWIKKEGDHINNGVVLCEVETDKATMDYESTTDGSLLKIVALAGSQVKVGETIAVAGALGENIEHLLSISGNGQKKSANGQSPAAPQERHTTQLPELGKGLSQRVKASPLAKEFARQKGIDLQTVSGSGPQGRIIKEDIERITAQEKYPVERAPVPGVSAGSQVGERVPVSDKRKIIAQRLSESMFTAPHYYMSINVCVDTVLSARNSINARSENKISLNAYLIKFTAEALKKNPVVNSSWDNDAIVYNKSIDIGLAVAQKDGLITPVVRNCAQKGIVEIDKELKIMVEKARTGKLQYEEYSNASFTISNLGSFGVRSFTAIINPPGAAIMAVGEIFKEPYFDEKGMIAPRNCIVMTLSCDHRLIDGAVAAEFAKDLKNLIENPITILY